VASKKDIGARKRDLSSVENMDCDASRLKETMENDLANKNIIKLLPIIEYTVTNFNLLVPDF